MINSIADRAMLVGLRISQFNPTKTDKKISAEVAQTHNSDASMGRYAKSVIAKEAVEKLRKLAGEIRGEHARRTLPWAEDGSRILTSVGYSDYADWMRGANDKWDAEVLRFIGSWDDFVADARVKLNGMFNAADYPSKEELPSKFSFRWTVRPIPVAEDFRVNLAGTEIRAIRDSIEAEGKATIANAMQDVFERMKSVVYSMAERLKAFDPNEPGAHPFRDSLVTNIQDLLQVLPALNLTGDARIAKFTAEMNDLVQFDAKELRDNAWKRNDVAARADAILDQMNQFVA